MSKMLTPAYGRDYKSRRVLLADFNADKDFVCIEWGRLDRYINKSQIEKGEYITFRHDKNRKSFSHIVR